MFKKEIELREKIKDLEREMKYQALDYERLVSKAKIDLREELWRDVVNQRTENAENAAKLAEVEKRWDEGSYKQLSDILKALVVKLPTLEIKELHAHSKGE